jgi:hypothetical protein
MDAEAFPVYPALLWASRTTILATVAEGVVNWTLLGTVDGTDTIEALLRYSLPLHVGVSCASALIDAWRVHWSARTAATWRMSVVTALRTVSVFFALSALSLLVLLLTFARALATPEFAFVGISLDAALSLWLVVLQAVAVAGALGALLAHQALLGRGAIVDPGHSTPIVVKAGEIAHLDVANDATDDEEGVVRRVHFVDSTGVLVLHTSSWRFARFCCACCHARPPSEFDHMSVTLLDASDGQALVRMRRHFSDVTPMLFQPSLFPALTRHGHGGAISSESAGEDSTTPAGNVTHHHLISSPPKASSVFVATTMPPVVPSSASRLRSGGAPPFSHRQTAPSRPLVSPSPGTATAALATPTLTPDAAAAAAAAAVAPSLTTGRPAPLPPSAPRLRMGRGRGSGWSASGGTVPGHASSDSNSNSTTTTTTPSSAVAMGGTTSSAPTSAAAEN